MRAGKSAPRIHPPLVRSKIDFFTLDSLLFNYPIKTNGFLTVLKIGKKSSLGTLLALLFFCSFFPMHNVLHKCMQTPFFLMLQSNKNVVFESLEISKTLVKPI